jgi:ABC-2 type transport system ATP-binding protein
MLDLDKFLDTPAHELVAWLGARYSLRDVTFQEPEIEDVIRRIYEVGLLLGEYGVSTHVMHIAT